MRMGQWKNYRFELITPTSNSQGHFGYCDGFKMTNNSLAGFGTISSKPRNAWGKYSNKCSSTGCMINKHELISILEEQHDGLDNLTGEQGIICTNNAFSQLKRLARRDMASGIVQKSKYFDLIVACLESPISESKGQE